MRRSQPQARPDRPQQQHLVRSPVRRPGRRGSHTPLGRRHPASPYSVQAQLSVINEPSRLMTQTLLAMLGCKQSRRPPRTAVRSPMVRTTSRQAGITKSASGYAAFPSYSHALDGRLGAAVQTGLERFAKPWYRIRALRVFRDKLSLSASPGLWSSIERGLEASEWLLLMASPEAARSPWVRKEVGWWLQHRSADRLLIVLTSGQLAWDSAQDDFEWSRTDALPEEVLRGAFAEEPFWVICAGCTTRSSSTSRILGSGSASRNWRRRCTGSPRTSLSASTSGSTGARSG